MNRRFGLADHIEHEVRLGKHRDVTAIGLKGRGFHALRDETLQLGLDSMVLRSYDVPTRLRSRMVKILVVPVASRMNLTSSTGS